ncbi:GNAT family N-acetyltransferase [Streptomyces sp. NPDC001594]|uniref:GNAT family N-acetyltransferase n=1 Tax=Streptomyces sp. NPDC001594 TaxID=3364590 RepID=UPI0036934C6C
MEPHADTAQALLERLEGFFDAVPRNGARAEDHGPLTLFIREGSGWPFYARPLRGWQGRPVTAADVSAVRARQRELGVPEAFEWVAETAPGLRAAVEESGLEVHEYPLMVLVDDASATALDDPQEGVSVRMLTPGDEALAGALAMPHVAFAAPGTTVGAAGSAELAEVVESRAGDGSVERSTARIRAGLTGIAAALEEGDVLSSGQRNSVDGVSEVVAVGTLPAARRRGLGLAVTAALIADARAQGSEVVFLSASDDDVARMYGRLGFRRVGTALTAEPAEA